MTSVHPPINNVKMDSYSTHRVLQDKILDNSLATPAMVIDIPAIQKNLSQLSEIRTRTRCRILSALKAFSSYSSFETIRSQLDGAACSSPNEVFLASETFGGHIHLYSPAYSESDLIRCIDRVNTLVFNSCSQLDRLHSFVKERGFLGDIGLRINPNHSEVSTAIYDPCRFQSRLGVCKNTFDTALLPYIQGFHMHTLCDSHFDAFERTVEVFEHDFSDYFSHLKWLNLGGGQLLTDPHYNIDGLCQLINRIQRDYDLTVILEPGAAVVYNAGYMVTRVLDVIHQDGLDIAILDASASTHMPDVLEYPYRPTVMGSVSGSDSPFTYQLAGRTCLAGDIIGKYSFDNPLIIGDPIIFTDMAQYSMVKWTQFNGLSLPCIYHLTGSGTLQLIKEFGYNTFKNVMG